MSYLNKLCSQAFTPKELPAAVRAAAGKPLRRATALTQLALLGALACIPAERRKLPSALLWQSTRGPTEETRTLLNEVCLGAGEPMPFDFLATQPAIAAAQILPFLPGLQSATHFPLAEAGCAQWATLLQLADNWLTEARYQQVLIAHLDAQSDLASGEWLLLGREPLENSPCRLQIADLSTPEILADSPEFPARLSGQLATSSATRFQIAASGRLGPALQFARL